MRVFLIRRLVSIVFVWWGVTLLTFFIANVIPSDPIVLRLGPKANPESVAYWRHKLGLDQPVPLQYIHYINGLFKGDLGNSIWSGRPIAQDLADYLPATVELSLSSLFLAVVFGIPLGLAATYRPDGIIDRLIQLLATFGLAMPLFWLGLVVQLLFYRQWDVLPLDSRIDLVIGPPHRLTGFYILDSLLQGDMQRFGNSLLHIILPSVTLAMPVLGALARMTRASVLEILTMDYVRTARAKGAHGLGLLVRHVLRNALLPVVTLLGNLVNSLLAGAFVVEAIFNWPGLGWYATRVILASDYGAVVSITLVIAFISTTVNLVVDILYKFLDPRIVLS